MMKMKAKNITHVSEFYLLRVSDDPELQPILCGLFLSMYLISVLGNMLIILAISSFSQLHTPMYFFLSILSLADIGFISTTVPNMVVDLRIHSLSISFVGCLTQMSFFVIFVVWESMILTVMAYDRFVAICHPLHYTVTMNPCRCGILVLVSFSASLFEALFHNLIVLQTKCFKDVEIANFFCDPSQLINLACSKTFNNSILMFVVAVIFGVLPFSGILVSYIKIISSILRISSLGGRNKAFSTCGSHLAVVLLFYGTAFGEYFSSVLSHSSGNKAVVSLMYTVVTPMLNPFIYSLRNQDISSSLKRIHSLIV